MDELKKLITPAINSCKEKLSLRQLNKDYKTLIGENIPYQRFGFRSLEDLLQSQPEYRLTRAGNETYVEVVVQNGNSSHMSRLVKQQKSGKHKPLKSRPMYRPPPLNRNHSTSRYRPRVDNRTGSARNYNYGQSRPQAVHHAQFVTRTSSRPATPSVASRVQIPEGSSYNRPALRNVSQNVPTQYDKHKRTVESYQKSNSNNVKASECNNSNQYLVSHNGKATASNNVSTTQSKRVQNDDESTNPLISSRRRINKKMCELNLDSGHSSPTSDIPQQLPSPFGSILPSSSSFINPAQASPSSPLTPSFYNAQKTSRKSNEFVRTENPLEDLKLLAKLHKLGEVIVEVTNVNNKHVKFYSCKIKVGKNTFSSYPKDFYNANEATAFCSNEALENLIPKCRQKSLMISSETDILERIPPMLEKHRYGIFSTQLSHNYAVQYHELLPDDWLKTIDASPCVRIEKISDNNQYILYHCKPGDVLQRGQQRSPGGLIIPVSVPTNTVKFSEEGQLICVVTRVMSANEIWCQQVETEENTNYIEMFDRMQVYYTEHEQQCIPEEIVKGAYYIAKFQGDYYRVRVVEVEEDTLGCFFIDSGEETSMAKTDIFTLTSVYATCQAQAFVCRLAGLEDWYEMSANSQCLASLQDEQVYLELASDVTNNDGDQMALPVYMYTTTYSCINETLIPLLTMEAASPNLQQDITNVYISFIEGNGNVYVQVRSQGYMEFVNLKAQIESQFNVNPPTNPIKLTKSNCQDKLFFTQYEGNWHRVKVIDWSPEAQHLAQIYFVDEGRTAVIDTYEGSDDKLYPLENVDEFLNSYPHQAIRVRMALDRLPVNFTALAEKALPIGQSALLKCVGTKIDDIPLVKLYKRSDDDGLFCINESIALECELSIKKEEEQKHKFKFLVGTAPVPSTGSLKCPPLKVNAFFEVKVVMAVSPYNFIVQPHEFELQLNTMMERLQEKCEKAEYGKIKVEDIVPGNIYASKHEDGIWYRANVIKVVNSGTSVSVFFCDFGNYQTLSVNSIVPLDSEFLELPYMALKAKLAGIKPTHNKWTMEDCERFKELVENKLFHAVIIDMEKDVLYQYDKVLRLKLLDTSLEDDLLIDEELIKLGIAVTEETV
ncbi:unnamed protein product [Ceutorhynchus assimilis]|uniref:Tudor domain-containing protein 7 n=1 Tax=Ceutorhynchus assimilis TaxID=467358 RepID=A0A9P0DJ14_9CUCU|nr:unnamed protein product [Ceutorhynchus assimilis]